MYLLAIDFGLNLLFYTVIYLLFRKGIGMGDVKLLFILGLAFGFKHGYLILLAALLVANITVISGILFQKIKRRQKIPFVPFLLAGFLFYLILPLEVIT
ncbi:signal peptidase [Listeria floridensis FSL S10-1187]|uniref:Signal peptidase n=1 Tax=Listeria floridensis FSL S10-1187 TaxID=1265817 RepID=A0ABP3B145_9LIST|nr:signal peptidase [Listeria floridensis FSL S10-1187]